MDAVKTFIAVMDLYPDYREEAEFLTNLANQLRRIAYCVMLVELDDEEDFIEYLDREMRKLNELLEQYSDFIIG